MSTVLTIHTDGKIAAGNFTRATPNIWIIFDIFNYPGIRSDNDWQEYFSLACILPMYVVWHKVR